MVWLLMEFEESAVTAMEALCLLGWILSLLCTVIKPLRAKWAFLLLWALYFSLHELGQTFLWFQWDSLLLELGMLGVFLAPWWHGSDSHHDASLGLALWRWFAFRLLFSSGVVKLTSLCPTWWDLSALKWHFESQCIPTALAWYARQLPEWMLEAGVAATYPFLMVGGLFALLPLKPLRWLAFLLTACLQILIFLTGNYNFFNIATVILSLSMLESSTLTSLVPARLVAAAYRLEVLASLAVGVAAVAGWVYLFQIGVALQPSPHLTAQIGFSQTAFLAAVDAAVFPTAVLGVLACGLAALMALVRAARSGRTLKVLWCVAAVAVAGGLFAVSLEPYSWLSAAPAARMPVAVTQLHEAAQGLQLAHPYGLFRRMTGVGGRPEVVVQLSRNGRDWTDLDFRYKITNVSRMPALISPHQPRLDWQMWFAALGTFQHNPWLVHLAIQLMRASPTVLQLFPAAVRRDIAAQPPTSVRMVFYKYHFALDGPAWWWREEQDTYMSALEISNPWCNHFLQHHGFGLPVAAPTLLARMLARLRGVVLAAGDYWHPIEGADMFLPRLCWTLVLLQLLPGLA